MCVCFNHTGEADDPAAVELTEGRVYLTRERTQLDQVRGKDPVVPEEFLAIIYADGMRQCPRVRKHI